MTRSGAPDPGAGAPIVAAARPADRPRTPEGARPEPVRCPAELTNCTSAIGVIAYVEAVDSDGDGDAHFVLLSDEAVTAPGISVIDVARRLRSHPLPDVGDRISAAGPVYRGSDGQRQIEAVELRVGR